MYLCISVFLQSFIYWYISPSSAIIITLIKTMPTFITDRKPKLVLGVEFQSENAQMDVWQKKKDLIKSVVGARDSIWLPDSLFCLPAHIT